MSEETTNSNRKRRVIRQAVIGLSVLALFVLAAWYLTSPQFHDFARKRLVTQLEDITGGRVEVGSFRWNLSKLEFDVSNVTIHGLEGPDEVPYAHADRLLIRAKILSLFGREMGLRWLQIEKPVVHVIVYPDGHTNQPTPKVIQRHEGTPVQRIFELAINHAEINDGQLLLNNRKVPLDFSADQLKAVMNYVETKQRFDGEIRFGALRTKYANFLPADADADVQFQVFKDWLEITGFHVVTAKSKIDGSGKLTNFMQPQVELVYRATVDGRDVARVTRTPELKAGIFTLNGTAKFANGRLTSQGKVVVQNGEYRIPEIRLANVDAAADFTFDPQTLNINHIVARVFGGTAKGEIAVNQWLERPSATGPQTGTAKFRVDTVPVRMAADAFSTKRFDLGRLNLTGAAQGTVSARWKGTLRRVVADLNVTTVPPANPGANELAITADLNGTFDGATGRLKMDPLNLASPDFRLKAVGVLGSMTEELRLNAAVADISKLQPMLTMLNQQNSAAAQLTGSLKFDGTLSGKLSSPAIQGKVEVGNFEFPLAVLLSAPAPGSVPTQQQPKRLHIDSGSAEIALNQQGIIVRNGVVHRAGSQANFDLSAVLRDGMLVDESRIVSHVVVRDASFADLQQIAGYNFPVTGTVSVNVNISGTKLSPEGGGRFQLTNATIYGEPVKSVSAELELGNQEARIRNFVLAHNGAKVTGAGDYNLNTTAFRFQVVGSDFQLATVRRLQNSRATLAGLLNFNATGSGTAHNPIINASARFHNMVVNGQRIGDATLTAITQGDSLHLNARTNFQTAELMLDGNVKMHDPAYPANVSVRFTNFDFMPYLQPLLPGRITARSFSEGTFVVQGPLREPRKLTVKAEIPKLTAEMQGIELHNSEPIQLSLMNGIVRVDSFKMVGPDTQMDVRGTVRVAEDDRVRLRAEGRMNLKLAQSLDPDINSAGFADFNVSVGGVLTKPTVQGEVRITNGSFNLIDFPNGLSKVNGSLVFTEDRVQVQSLTAHTGGGDITIGGFATYSPRLAFNLTAAGKDIRLRYPQGISSTADLDLKLTGTMSSATLSGDVIITRFGLNSQFDLANYVARGTRPLEAQSGSILNNLHLNVHVTSTPELQVQSSLAKLAGNVDMRVRGTGTNPVLLGRVNVTEGQVSFNGTNYRLERGDVTFNNPTKTEPNIDVEATTRVRDYDITLGFHGQLAHGLNTNYRSDPPLPQADIINLLAFGRTREEAELVSQAGGTSYAGVMGNAILGQALNSAVGDRVQKLFGVSRVKIAPDVSSTQTNPTAQVTIEQQVSNKVTITYITNLSQSSQQAIFVEYTINPQLSLIGGRDQYGVVSFDVKIRQRKR